MDALQSSQPFQPYLLQGERIVWSGRPKQGIAFSRSDLMGIPFSIMWCGFIIFWNVSVWNIPDSGTSDDWFFKLWGLPSWRSDYTSWLAAFSTTRGSGTARFIRSPTNASSSLAARSRQRSLRERFNRCRC
jgi:hypothetical protein